MLRSPWHVLSRVLPCAVLAAASSVWAEPVVEKLGAGHVIGFTPNRFLQSIPGQAAEEAGLAWTREDFPWHIIQRDWPRFSWGDQDDVVNNAREHGLNVLGLLAYVARECSTEPERDNYFIFPDVSAECLAHYADYVRTVVSRYKDRVRHWQVWPSTHDYFFWGFTPEYPGFYEYHALVTTAYRAIKDADPTATVLLAGMRSDFLERFLEIPGAVASFDALAVDNYAFSNGNGGQPAAPEVSILTSLRLASFEDVSERLGGKRIWVTESGWSTGVSEWAVDEQTQAAYAIRSLLLQAREPGVDRVFWEAFHDYGLDWLQQFGLLLRRDYSEKPSFSSYTGMTGAIQNARYRREEPPEPDARRVIDDFEQPGDYRVYTGGGAQGSITRVTDLSQSGLAAARVDYQLTEDPNSAVVLVREVDVAGAPSRQAIPGAPTRIKLWARGDGGAAAMLAAEFVDASGEVFSPMIGLVVGNEWRQMQVYLDAPAGTSSLLSSAGGNFDKIIDYPITWNGLSVRRWPDSAPVGAGSLWLDGIELEDGPSLFNLVYEGRDRVVHALWSLRGAHRVQIPTAHAGARLIDHANWTTDLVAAEGSVSLYATEQPAFVVFPPHGDADKTGVFRPSNGALYLKYQNSSGFADADLFYGSPGDRGLAGDWDGDGIDTIGIFRAGRFLLRNQNTPGYADLDFAFGSAADLPIVGDWDGDGVDSIGVYRDGQFLLRNRNAAGPPDIAIEIGAPGDLPLAGDWTGQGYDTCGLYRPSSGDVFLLNDHEVREALISWTRARVAGDKPVSGDWNGDGMDSVGFFRQGEFLLRNSLSDGPPEARFLLGTPDDDPIIGRWTALP